MNKSQKLESEYSTHMHKGEVALLVSSLILRRRGMGQIDVACLRRDKLIVAECKSGQSILSYKQRRRLRDSLFFLGCIFRRRGTLIKVQSSEEFAKSSPSAYPFKVSKIMELT